MGKYCDGMLNLSAASRALEIIVLPIPAVHLNSSPHLIIYTQIHTYRQSSETLSNTNSFSFIPQQLTSKKAYLHNINGKVIVLSCWLMSLDEIMLCWFSTQSSGFIGFIYISVFYFIYKKNMNDLALTLIYKEKIIFTFSIIISSARNSSSVYIQNFTRFNICSQMWHFIITLIYHHYVYHNSLETYLS